MSTLGGAMAGYLLSNKKLRDELAKADDPESVAKALGKHLQKDGKKIAKEVQAFLESEDVQGNITKAKGYAKQKCDEASGELKKMVGTQTKKAKGAAVRARRAVPKTAKKGAATAKAAAKKGATKAKATAKKKVTKKK